MRRLIIAAAAFAALASAGSLAGTAAQAMPLSGLSDQATSSVVPVYTKCRWVSDGYGGRVQQCWEVYDAPRTYYPPRQYYGGGGYGYGGGYRGGY
ncbi:MAG: hypothetical protein NTZ72_03510 [Afipia sp.]|jgi:hypothetical protein|nr:hypothetical protein [Afipia sp.]